MIRIATLCLVLSFAAPAFAQLNGTYSIDAGSPASATNYQSVGAAFSDLSSGTRSDGGPVNGPGVAGPVVLRIVTGSGPYLEQVTIPAITGASAVNTIRLTGGPGREMITFSATTTADRQVIKLSGARHITLDSLTLVNTGATYGYGVHITNSADSNVVSNSSIIVSTTATSTNYSRVTISGTTVATNGDNGDDNLILNNNINGGYYGVTMRGTGTTVFNQRNKVIGNTVQDYYYYGVYCYYQNMPEIRQNIISARSTATTSAYGIYLYYADQFVVERNKLNNLGTYGIYTYYGNYQGGTGTNRARIVNNMIGGGWLGTSPYGMYITTNSRYIDIFHNSVSMDAGNGRAIYILSGLGHDVQNNSLAITNSTTGYALYVTSTAYVTNVDYNNYYAPGSGNFIYVGTAYTTATYVGGGGFNANSRDGDPLYINNLTNLHTSGVQLHDAGTNVGVTTDYDGDTRPMAPTALYDIGADEFTPSLNDAGVTALVNPAQPFSAGVQNMDVVIYNYGAATLTSATINWDVNLVAQAPFAWTGSLATYTASAPVTIGTYNFVAGNTYNVRLWTSNPNGAADQQNANDTLEIQLCVSMSGLYTVGGVGADFPTISDAVTALVCGGVSGPVTLNLVQGAGPFNEQVIIPAIPGASSVRTIRINGGANLETVTYAATLTNLRAVIMLDGAKHIILDSLTITNTGTAYGYGVQLTNNADSNTVQNCIVSVSTTLTSSNFAGITISGATVTTNGDFGDYNLIQNNTVDGGYYSITMRGLSTTVFSQSNKVIGNTLTNFYYYGIYCYYQDQTEILNNVVSARPTATASGYGVYLGYVDRFLVERNRLFNLGGNGIYATNGNYQGGTGVARAKIVNNMIGGEWTDNTSPYGIYITTNGRYIDIWHNSVSMIDGNGRGLYMTSGLGNDVRNNSFAVYNSTTGYAVYISSTAYISSLDYNNYYAPGSGNFIYVGGAYTPANFIGAAGFNLNSVTGDPGYLDPSLDLHASGPLLYDAGANLGVNVDFDNDVRPLAPSTGYDIGADEYPVPSDDVSLIAIVTPANNNCADSNTVVSVIIENGGLDTITSMPVTANVTGYTTSTINFTYTGPLAFGQIDTVAVGTFNSHSGGSLSITAYSSLAGDLDNTNDTVSATLMILPIAPVAVAANDTACAGSPATLNVTPDTYAHNWYDASSGGNLLAAGDTFITPPLATTTTYYVEALTRTDATMSTTYAGGNGCDGAMFDIIPSVNMTVDSFALNIGTTATEVVRVFWRVGSYVGNETNAAAWTMLGPITVTGNGAGNPTYIPLGGIPMIAGQTYGIYTALSANLDYTTGSQTFSNGEMTIVTGSGLCAPFGSVNAGRIWNGTVFYTKEVCPNPVRTPVTVTVLQVPVVSLGNDTTVCGPYTLDAGTNGSTYAWSTGATTQFDTASVSGQYFVAVTDSFCTGRDTIQLTVNPLPVLVASAVDGSICPGDSDTIEVVTPPATTVYTVYGVDNNGCADSANVTITVNPLPPVSYSASSPAVCTGGSVTLSGTGATTYTWTGGVNDGVAFTPSSTATYTVTGTDANGCSDTAAATIVVNPLPSVSYTASATTVCENDTVTLSGTGASTYVWTGGVTDNVAFTATATSTYTVTGTDANGCEDTDSVTINVNPAPNVGFTATATAVCAGSPVTLTGTGATGYSWTGGITDNVAFTPAATGSYVVTGTDGNGCTDTATANITVNALPNVSLTLGFSTICFDDANAVLTGGSPAGGTYSGPSVASGAFDPSAAGNGVHTIQYTYTDGNGCTNNAIQQVTVDPCTGVNDPSAQELFSLYPNPNNGQFTLVLNGTEAADVMIYDALGQMVAQERMLPGTQEMRIDGPSGVYLVTVVSADGSRVQRRVVVER